MTADQQTAGFFQGADPAQDHLAEQLEGQLAARPTDQLQSGARGSAHGVDIRKGIGRSDPAPIVGIVDDRSEIVHRLHHETSVGQAQDPGVVAGVQADDQVGVDRRWMVVQGAQDLRQLVRAELACSTAAVRKLGQFHRHHAPPFRPAVSHIPASETGRLIAMIIDMWDHRIMQPVVECCAPLVEEPLDKRQATHLAGWFRVLGDPARLRLLSVIANLGEACAACDLVEPIGVSQPTVSHHLKVLFEAGLVEREKRGRWVYYRAVPERLAVLSRALGGPTPG